MLANIERSYKEKLDSSFKNIFSVGSAKRHLNDLMLFSYVHGGGIVKDRLHLKISKHSETLASSRNLGKLKHLSDYFQSMRKPFSPLDLYLIGEDHFLQITKPVVLNPRGKTGVCVGASLCFLRNYFQLGQPTKKQELQKIASLFVGGAPRNAVAVQNLYCGLFTDEKLVNESERIFYQSLFQILPLSEKDWENLEQSFSTMSFSNKVSEQIFSYFRSYFQSNEESDLREYLMLCLNAGEGILDAKTYALIRHIASCHLYYIKKESILEKKFSVDTFCAAASMWNLELQEVVADTLSFENTVKSLENLPKGAFFFSLQSHSRVWVVLGNDEYVLFDPNKGTQWISGRDNLKKVLKKEVRSQFHVSKGGSLSIGRLTRKYEVVSRDVLILQASELSSLNIVR